MDAPEQDEVLDFLYKEIGCNTVDVAYLPDGLLGWVDDEGLLKSGNVVCEYGGAPLAGTVILSMSETTDEGETKWLETVEDIESAIDMAEKSELKGVTNDW
jgi:hypothetical protein